MSDTVRTEAELLALFPDNNTRQISAQDMRDLIVSVFEAVRNTAQDTELAQVRPPGTSPTTLLAGGGTKKTVNTIQVANTTAGAVTFRLMNDDDGATFDESTALAWDVSLAGNSILSMGGPFIVGANGAMAVRVSVSDALTFTVYGQDDTS